MGIPIIIVLISLVFKTNAQFVADGGQGAIIQTGPGFDAQLVGPIGSGDDFGGGGFLPMIGLPLLGLLLLLGFAGGATPPITPPITCPPCTTIVTTTCPTATTCTPAPTCPAGFERLGSTTGILTKCYGVATVAAPALFGNAKAACYAKGGTLAEFTNAGESAAVTTFLTALGGAFFIGYSENSAGNMVGVNSNAAANGVTLTATEGGNLECATLTGATPTVSNCGTITAPNAICETRIDSKAVSCACA